MFSYKIVATTSTVADLEETYGGTFQDIKLIVIIYCKPSKM